MTRTQSGAVGLLNRLYEKMFVEGYRKIVPIQLLMENFKNIFALNDKLLGSKGPWEYFAGRHIFDARTEDVSGFNDQDSKRFAVEWNEAVLMMKNLMPDLAEAFQPKEKKTNAKKGKK